MLMDTARTVRETIRDHNLVTSGDSILVALSGGPDSVALLHLLSRHRKSMKLNLTAVYINHQIRKKAALLEEKFCQKLCDSLKVELDIVSEDIPALAQRRKMGLEEAAREFRYELFDLLAVEDHHERIALGHHADDRVETILFRILRGTGTSGLSGIPIKRGKIIRPLYYLTKQDILEYLSKQDLEYCIDQSNEGVDFRRNYIRNRLLVNIRKELNPQVDRAILGLSAIAAADDRFLEQVTEKAAANTIRWTPGGKIELDLTRLSTYDTAIRRRLLRYCLKMLSATGEAPDRVVIERLEHLATAGGRALSVPGRLRAVRAGNMLVIHRTGRLSFQKQLDPGRTLLLDRPAIKIRSEVETNWTAQPIKERGTRKVTLDLEKIKPPLVVRSIKPGDRFRPLGLGGSKKVGDYLTDKKVEPVFRDEIPVICDAEGIIWLVGFEIDDRVKVDVHTGKVITIEVSDRKSGAAATI